MEEKYQTMVKGVYTKTSQGSVVEYIQHFKAILKGIVDSLRASRGYGLLMETLGRPSRSRKNY